MKSTFFSLNLTIFIALIGASLSLADFSITKNLIIDRKPYDGWEKLSSSGEPINIKEGPWLCARDPANGLVWENKSAFEGLHHANWTYTWTIKNSRQEGSCNSLTPCHVDEMVRIANQQKWCGKNNWRVPSIDELQTLVDLSYPQPGPLICPCLFPNTKKSSYWALSADRQHRFVGLNFRNGEVRAFPEHAALYLRLVSSDN